MRRPSPWLIVVVILLGYLILHESQLQQLDDRVLAWFTTQADTVLPPAQVTLVEIGRDDIQSLTPPDKLRPLPQGEAARRSLSPLEYALFLQAVLGFKPAVVGIEPLLIWRSGDKAQEQVLIDQAMRVPKLVVALELGGKGERNLQPDELPVFSQVSGERGNVAEYSGVARQPSDDLRLISAPGLVAPPGRQKKGIRVPMIFDYQGAIVPSFPLEAILLWLRATPADVQVQLGSQMILPNGWKIPLQGDGTTLINPAAAASVHLLGLNDLLLGAQELDRHQTPTRDLSDLQNQIVLLRLQGDPLQGPNIFATTVATIQTNGYIRAASGKGAWLIILAAALLAAFHRAISRANLVIGAILFTAGYAMTELMLLEHDRLWLPFILPLVLVWFIVIVRMFDRDGGEPKRAPVSSG